jgi:hypothetical protein
MQLKEEQQAIEKHALKVFNKGEEETTKVAIIPLVEIYPNCYQPQRGNSSKS